MVKTISAEFKSFDQAEFVSKKIKDRIDGIEKIIIKSDADNNNRYNPFGHSSEIANSTTQGNSYFNSLQFPNFYDETDSPVIDTFLNETFKNPNYILEIQTTDENINYISSVIAEFGGFNIKS